MSDFWHAALGLFAAVAPFGSSSAFEVLTRELPGVRRGLVAVGGGAVALAFLAASALLSDPFFDLLAVSGENFQLAAGLIMLPPAFQLLLRGEPLRVEEQHRVWWLAGLAPLAIPLLVGPASVAAAIAYGWRYGSAETVGASALVLVVSAIVVLAAPCLGRRPGLLSHITLGRFSGALLVVVAVELMIDGVRSV